MIPTTWLDFPAGEMIQQELQQELDRVLSTSFGYYLLTVGVLSSDLDYSESKICHHIALSPDSVCDVHSQLDAMAIQADSVDLLVLTGVLDFVDAPHGVLREAHRVLIPNGKIIIASLNPWSLWGAASLFKSQEPSWKHSRFLSAKRQKDWLSLLGFDLTVDKSLFFRPPINNIKYLNKLSFLDKAGRKFWSAKGAINWLVAQKKQVTLTPIKEAWRDKAKLFPVGQMTKSISAKQKTEG